MINSVWIPHHDKEGREDLDIVLPSLSMRTQKRGFCVRALLFVFVPGTNGRRSEAIPSVTPEAITEAVHIATCMRCVCV
jgi:hypothetical protein